MSPFVIRSGVSTHSLLLYSDYLLLSICLYCTRYICAAIRDPNWTVDWAGNVAINIHREGSIELLHLALDYYEHTLDKEEFATSILPLATEVLNFVSTCVNQSHLLEKDVKVSKCSE